jgi:hypothetical protein
VKSGTLEPAAATDGSEVRLGAGLFIAGGAFWSGARAKLDSVAILDADMLRAGDAGRGADVKGEGDGCAIGGGAGVALCEEGWRAIAGTNCAESGADGSVGVA